MAISNATKYLGATLDSDLNFDDQITQLCTSTARALGVISRVKRLLPTAVRKVLIDALVISRLDYCDLLLLCSKKGSLQRLQQLQNRAAKIALGVKNRFSSEDALKLLDWLPLEQRRTYHLGIEVFKSVRQLGPTYMSDLIAANQKFHGYDTRSSHVLPRLTGPGQKSFSYLGTKLWSVIPATVKIASSLESFKSGLFRHLQIPV